MRTDADLPGFERRSEGRIEGLVAAELSEIPLVDLYSAGRPLGDVAGRAAVSLIDLVLDDEALTLVARDYRRGGMFAGVIPGRSVDRFADQGRAVHELRLLSELESLAVPSLRPFGALALRVGRSFRLRLLTRFEERALPIARYLQELAEGTVADTAEAETVVAASLGKTLRSAFEVGLEHPDLHPDNLLVRDRDGEPEVLIIDLDGGRLVGRPLTVDEEDRMLVRAARYAVKHRDRLGLRPSARSLLVVLEALERPGRTADARSRLVSLHQSFVRQCRRRRRRYALTDSELEGIEADPTREL